MEVSTNETHYLVNKRHQKYDIDLLTSSLDKENSGQIKGVGGRF